VAAKPRCQWRYNSLLTYGVAAALNEKLMTLARRRRAFSACGGGELGAPAAGRVFIRRITAAIGGVFFGVTAKTGDVYLFCGAPSAPDAVAGIRPEHRIRSMTVVDMASCSARRGIVWPRRNGGLAWRLGALFCFISGSGDSDGDDGNSNAVAMT